MEEQVMLPTSIKRICAGEEVIFCRIVGRRPADDGAVYCEKQQWMSLKKEYVLIRECEQLNTFFSHNCWSIQYGYLKSYDRDITPLTERI